MIMLERKLRRAGFRIIGQIEPSTKQEINKIADDFMRVLDEEVTGFDKNTLKKALVGFLTTAVLFSTKEATAPDLNADLAYLKQHLEELKTPQEVSVELAFNIKSGEYKIDVDGYILQGVYQEKPVKNIHKVKVKKTGPEDQDVREMMQNVINLLDKAEKK